MTEYSPYSSEVIAATDHPAVGPLIASSVTETSVTLSTGAVVHPPGTTLEYEWAVTGPNPPTVQYTPGPTATFTGLQPGSSYTFTVRSVVTFTEGGNDYESLGQPTLSLTVQTDSGVAPQSPNNPIQQPVLRGFTNKLSAFGAPMRLEGRAKLESDMGFIVRRVLLARGLLKITLSEADLGNVSKILTDELENPENWWAGQSTPISLSEVRVTRRSVTAVGGVTASEVGDDGDLEIRIGYTERTTGVVVSVEGADALVIPFGAYFSQQTIGGTP
jgi:hypothetical protein